MSTHSASGFSAIRPLLARIGLDEKEIEVYLAVLSLKVARASAVSAAAKTTRSHTYLILRNLEKKGLIAEVVRGKVIHFIAEPPHRLKQYVEEREREMRSLVPLVDGILPLLSSLTKPLSGAPRVTTLQGKEGMRQLYRDGFNEGICGIFNPQVMYEAFDGNIVTMLLGEKPNMRGRDLVMQTPMTKQYLEEVQPNEDYVVRLLPKTIQFETDTMIFKDIVALLAYDDQRTIVRIENKNIADAFRSWFEAMWSMSTPV